ncbi:hypothetical protein GPK34_00355 [Secundilactobacillus kimchicus]|uniref:hypothetical protein n=1 Tax=Secundilactobacillus kimchicus TaxID=528209 RepID=UPI001C030404|nr:hypothetical protein [Secundilactobacillus kimchicus]MBT9670488.1 hypothetical protein [Secundilactobacillus kimchicus]
MTEKLSGAKARYFKELVKGDTPEMVSANIREEAMTTARLFSMNDEDKAIEIENRLEDLQEAKDFFDKVKLIEPETYAVDAWGFEQTNYENLTVVGTARGSVVVIYAGGVYTISKAKYTAKKPGTALESDHVIMTSWEAPYTANEIADQAMANAYTGH